MTTIYQVRLAMLDCDRDDVLSAVSTPSELYATLASAKASVELGFHAQRLDLEEGTTPAELVEFPRPTLEWTRDGTTWTASVDGADDSDPQWTIYQTEVQS